MLYLFFIIYFTHLAYTNTKSKHIKFTKYVFFTIVIVFHLQFNGISILSHFVIIVTKFCHLWKDGVSNFCLLLDVLSDLIFYSAVLLFTINFICCQKNIIHNNNITIYIQKNITNSRKYEFFFFRIRVFELPRRTNIPSVK